MIDFYSEEFSPHGGITSEGALNPLGRPSLDPLTVLVRESVQNCWDARVGEAPVEVTFELRTPTGAELDAFGELVRADARGRTGLQPAAAAGALPMLLTISDRGTSGLGGPLRANRFDKSERNDFVDFLRNIGQPPDRDHGGGTYGFGKAALYRASRCQTIFVHSRTRHAGTLQTRFMGAALSGQFHDGDRRFTGRHWWGRQAGDGVLDPLLDGDADEFAASLGLPSFEPDETGTSIAIAYPEFYERTPDQYMRFIRTALLWHFWPKMTSRPGERLPPMTFRLLLEGVELAAPDPERFPPLQGFARALRSLHDPSFEPDGVESVLVDVESYRPARHLGRLILRKVLREQRIDEDIGERDDPIPHDLPSAHIALLRTPELVVEYVPGPSLGNEYVEYVGVFRADDELDGMYAASEPPTHDRWEAEAVGERTAKTHIRNTYRRIQAAIQEFAAPAPAPATTVVGRSLAGVASRLGELLPGVDGTGAGRTSKGVVVDRDRTEGTEKPVSRSNEAAAGAGTGGSEAGSGGRGAIEPGGLEVPGGSRRRRRRAVVEVLGTPELTIDSGRRVLSIPFTVTHADDSTGSWVIVTPRVVLEAGDREGEAPLGSEQPQVLVWELPGGRRAPGESECFFDAVSAGNARVIVSVPEDAEIALELEVRAEAD